MATYRSLSLPLGDGSVVSGVTAELEGTSVPDSVTRTWRCALPLDPYRVIGIPPLVAPFVGLSHEDTVGAQSGDED